MANAIQVGDIVKVTSGWALNFTGKLLEIREDAPDVHWYRVEHLGWHPSIAPASEAPHEVEVKNQERRDAAAAQYITDQLAAKGLVRAKRSEPGLFVRVNTIMLGSPIEVWAAPKRTAP